MLWKKMQKSPTSLKKMNTNYSHDDSSKPVPFTSSKPADNILPLQKRKQTSHIWQYNYKQKVEI